MFFVPFAKQHSTFFTESKRFLVLLPLLCCRQRNLEMSSLDSIIPKSLTWQVIESKFEVALKLTDTLIVFAFFSFVWLLHLTETLKKKLKRLNLPLRNQRGFLCGVEGGGRWPMRTQSFIGRCFYGNSIILHSRTWYIYIYISVFYLYFRVDSKSSGECGVAWSLRRPHNSVENQNKMWRKE